MIGGEFADKSFQAFLGISRRSSTRACHRPNYDYTASCNLFLAVPDGQAVKRVHGEDYAESLVI
jgi:hypothetical protein